MDFDSFVLVLNAMNINWLKEEQLREIFDLIDDDSSGIVTEQEILDVGMVV